MGMSQAMGGPGVWLPGSQYKVYIKTGDLLNPVRPTSTFCWMNTRTASTQVVCKSVVRSPNSARSSITLPVTTTAPPARASPMVMQK